MTGYLSGSKPSERTVKARIVGLNLLDLAINLVVPLVVFTVLDACGLQNYLALAASGIVVGGKAGLGPIAEWRADRRLVVAAATVVLALAALAVLVVVGVPPVWAAAVGGAVIAVPMVTTLITRRHRIDGFGLFVLAEIVTSFAITLVSDDPRFVIARSAIYTAVGGGYAFVTCFVGRPLMLDGSRPMAAAGDPVRAAAFDRAWAESVAFQRIERIMTAGLGVLLVAEAAIRVALVYLSGLSVVALWWAANLPSLVLLVTFVAALKILAVPRVSAIVDSFMPAAD